MIAQPTVADLARPSEKKLARLYDILLVLGGSVIIGLCTQVAVGYPVPLTGQTFAVLMIGALLGSRRGALSVLAYIAQGLAGLPVFAYGNSGLKALGGPTGGYLVGFVLAAYVVGTLAERRWDRHIGTMVVAMVLGDALLFLCGLAWLACWMRLFGDSAGGEGILAVGLFPFVPGEIIKIALATAVLPAGWKLIRHFGFARSPEIH
jgi:biotin transport system substrate-specific component